MSRVDPRRGLVCRSVFSDREVFEREKDRLWSRSWLFVAPSSAVSVPGSLITAWMGTESVIVWRDEAGVLRVFANACPHNGSRLCWAHAARATTLTCPHGSAFDCSGRAPGDEVPQGLLEAPLVEPIGDLLFACWDRAAPGLDEHLGDLRWWLEKVVLVDELGGLEALPGCQRYALPANWKLYCDNFSGDGYHVPTTHASAVKLGVAGGLRGQAPHGYFTAALRGGHGIGWFRTDNSQYERDLEAARPLGSSAVRYVMERQRVIQAGLTDSAVRPSGGWVFGLCFPNLTMQGMNSALRGHVAGVCHPRTVDRSEVWQWCLIERAAPQAVKEQAAKSVARGQSAAGFIGVDDSENFERITQAAFSPSGRQLHFHYAMDSGVEGRWPGSGTWQTAGLPGLVGPELSEMGQRGFYRRWAEMVLEE